METTKQREDEVKDSGLDYFTQEQLIADPKLLEMYTEGNAKQAEWAADEAERRANAETTTLDRLERQYDIAKQQNDLLRQGMELSVARQEYNAENKFFSENGDGRDRAEIMQDEAEIAAEIKMIELETIKPLQDQIEEKQQYIKELEREFEINEDRIKDLQDEVEMEQRRVEDMQRSLEMRQREGEMLDHDLKLMSWREEEINEAYEKRMEALDKTLQINEAIAQSQQDQLGLADALSQGDIGAAAKAAQQMQQNQMQFASDQYRSGLETAQESQINSLTGAESGMTREQIEERQRQLEEDSYYTNLAIRDIEDEIYNLNRQIRDENDIINSYKDQIEVKNKKIRDYEWDIYNAEQLYLSALEEEQKKNNKLLAQADAAQTYAGNTLKIQKTRWDRESEILEAEQQLNIAGLKILDEQGIAINKNTGEMIDFGKAAAAAYNAIKSGNFDYKGKKGGKNYENKRRKATETLQKNLESQYKELTDGMTSMLSVPLDLSAVAIPDMSTASYNVPTAAVSAAATNGIMGNITNNTMNNNVNVNAQGASADEVADIVILRLAWEKMQNVGEL